MIRIDQKKDLATNGTIARGFAPSGAARKAREDEGPPARNTPGDEPESRLAGADVGMSVLRTLAGRPR